jgi:hypothetical protein
LATGQRALGELEADAAVYGLRRVVDANGKARWEVNCGHCDCLKDVFDPGVDHIEDVLSRFRKRGWIFARKIPPYCSTEHLRAAKAAEKEARKEEEMKHPPITHRPLVDPAAAKAEVARGQSQTATSSAAISTSLPAAVVPPAPDLVPNVVVAASIAPNPRIQRRVYDLLSEQYIEDKSINKGRFSAGWSDERVAKEANASLAYVVKVREEGYLPLAEDPEMTKVKGDIQKNGEKIERFGTEFDDKIAHLITEFSEKKAQLVTENDGLKARVDRLSQRAHLKAQG